MKKNIAKKRKKNKWLPRYTVDMKVVFFGTPLLSANTLAFLLDQGVNIVGVVTKPDRPQGRSRELVPTPVKKVLLEKNSSIPLFQPLRASSQEFMSILEALQADLFVVVAYGEILKQPLLDMPKINCLNVHFSLLPKYRGAAPIQRAIIAGETESGVTIMKMVLKLDAGPTIAMVSVPIGPNMTYGELTEELNHASYQSLLNVIHAYQSGIFPPEQAQDENFVTFAPKIELEECQVDWNQPAKKIHNLVRGVNPEPGAWCWIDFKGERKRLRIHRTKIVTSEETLPPGTLSNWKKNGLLVSCSENALELLELQLEGKKAMSGEQFLRGMPSSFKILV